MYQSSGFATVGWDHPKGGFLESLLLQDSTSPACLVSGHSLIAPCTLPASAGLGGGGGGGPSLSPATIRHSASPGKS